MAQEIYGIDLGTTNSCIAIINPADGQPQVINNQSNLQTTPSVVFYDEYDTPIVGTDAKNSMKQDPMRAVAFIKREMSNKNYKRNIGNEEISPVKISALILKKLVDDANLAREYEGKAPIHKAVITVPAYFGNDEHVLTRQAGEVAGLEVIGLLNEPTAAALSYGKDTFEGRTIMVYDLGGGTFDVSIIRMRNGNLETLSTDGDHHLGGVDWDERIVDVALAIEGFEVAYADIKDKKEGGAMILEAEACKKQLSTQPKAPMRFRYGGKLHTVEISQSSFKELTTDLLDRTIACTHHAINLIKEDVKIDEIILVGGSSRMPMVKERLMKEFPNIKIRLDRFEPDLAVAKGAALYAANTSVIDDKSARSYGILTVEGITNILLRTDPMVYNGTAGFLTASDNQTSAMVQVYENSSAEGTIPVSKGVLILKKELTWGKQVPKGTPVTARVSRGKDGILHIAMECEGSSAQIEIQPERQLSDSEVKKLKDEFQDIVL